MGLLADATAVGGLQLSNWQIPASWLEALSAASTPAILIAFGMHLLLFAMLFLWARSDLRTMLHDFDDFTRGLKHRSVLGIWRNSSDQVDAFLADIRETLEDPTRAAERATLHQRLHILDERRKYLHSVSFETTYTVARNMIDAYPLAGILGTLLAMGAALQANPASADAAGVLTQLVRYFGQAIWSTVAGLVAAMILMFLNSALETRFLRLTENRASIRETVARVKRELGLAPTAGAGPHPTGPHGHPSPSLAGATIGEAGR